MSDSGPYLSANDHVRLRPGMWFGGVGKSALHQLVYTVIDEAVPEILANRCSHLSVVIQSQNQITVSDNGLGVQTKFHSTLGKPFLEIIMTTPGNYRKHDLDYAVTGGLHGINMAAVNAVSSLLIVESSSDGYLWRQTYHAGIPQSDVIQVRKLEENESTGTAITFKPDFSILEKNEFDYELLREYLYELAAMLKQATFTIRDERVQPVVEKVYHFENGLISYLDDLRGKSQPLHFPVIGHGEGKILKDHRGGDTIQVDFAFQYIQSDEPQILSFANLVRTTGGTHVAGFYSALRKILRSYGRKNGLITSKNTHLTSQRISQGLIGIIHILHPSPIYEGSTRVELANPEVEAIVQQAVSEAFLPFVQQHPDVIEQIVRQCLQL